MADQRIHAAELSPRVAAAATPPHYIRRHRDILPGPSQGNQPNVWAFLLELLVEEESIAIGEEQQLLLHDAHRFADRAVLRTETILEAFRWLVRNDLVVIRRDSGRHFACPDLVAVGDLLRGQQALERAGARASGLTALTYFRSRFFWVRSPWIGRVLGVAVEERHE